MRVHTLAIHHSASRRNTKVQTIRAWHKKRWPRRNKIGYHRIITEDGKTHKTLELDEMGAHAPPNKGRIGICVTGDNTVPGRKWNMKQKRELVRQIRAFQIVYPGIEVKGHSQLKATLCPGVSIPDFIEEFVNNGQG